MALCPAWNNGKREEGNEKNICFLVLPFADLSHLRRLGERLCLERHARKSATDRTAASIVPTPP